MQCLKRRQSTGHERGTGRRERADPDPATVTGGQGGKGVLSVLDRGKYAGRVLYTAAELPLSAARPGPPSRRAGHPSRARALLICWLIAEGE